MLECICWVEHLCLGFHEIDPVFEWEYLAVLVGLQAGVDEEGPISLDWLRCFLCLVQLKWD